MIRYPRHFSEEDFIRREIGLFLRSLEKRKLAWHTIGPSETLKLELSENRGKELLVQGELIALFWIDGVFQAVDGICAHQGGPLAKGEVSGGCLTCPWHGWQYHLHNGYNAITHRPMLRVFEVREMAGNVEIALPD